VWLAGVADGARARGGRQPDRRTARPAVRRDRERDAVHRPALEGAVRRHEDDRPASGHLWLVFAGEPALSAVPRPLAARCWTAHRRYPATGRGTSLTVAAARARTVIGRPSRGEIV